MKTIVLTIIAAFFLQCTPKDGVTQDMGKLPAKARTFVETYFPDQELSYIKIDKGLTLSMYEVVFANSWELDFTKEGEWTEVDCKYSAVPAGIVPGKIASYVTEHFAPAFVTQIEKDGKRYQTDLSNGLELRFDKDGNFVGMDD